MAAIFFLVTLSNALQLEVNADLSSLEMETKKVTFETYEGSKHPVKEVALETALQNVQKLPKEIRVMLTEPNATLPEVSAHDRARAVKREHDKKARGFLTHQTTHGSAVQVDVGSGFSDTMDPMAKDPTQYATLDKVRKTLNDLYQQTLEEMDVEREGCFEAETTLKTQIATNTGIRVTLASVISMARGEIATANANIREAQTNLLELNAALVKHNEECAATLKLAEEKKAIIDSDLGVAQTVQNMTDCDKMASNAAAGTVLFQCMVHSDGRSHIHLSGAAGKMLTKMKSKTAFQAMLKAAKSSMGANQDPDDTKDVELPAGNFSQDEYDDWMKLDQDTKWMDGVGVADLPKDCKALDGKIDLGEKCAVLYDAVTQMVGEISDAQYYMAQFIDNTTESCRVLREDYEAQISDWDSVLSQNQIALAEATTKLNTNTEALRKRVEEFMLLRDELIKRMKECNENLLQLFNEMCGLITIRNELYKMSGVQVYMQDCQVGDWEAQECTVTCGGGTQQFTRDITQEQYFGAACPPLSKVGMCNTDPCPIDCVYENDWSEWSACSADCGGGVMQRNRRIHIEDQNGGVQCEATAESVQCNLGACDADCELGEWTEWAGCSKMCDSGIQTRRKMETKEVMGTGVCAHPDETDPAAEGGGARFETRPCNTAHCLGNIACNSMLDAVLVLDGSGSVGWQGWYATQRFTKDLIDRMYLNYDDGATVGVVLFSRVSEIVHQMSGDKAALDTAVANMRFPRSWTMTGEAIRVAMNMMANGGRAGVPGVVFVVTDGRPTYEWDATAAAEEARRSGTRLFFIGVGRNMDWAAMGRWATAPSTQNLEFVENYAKMDDKIAALTADLCPSIQCKETFEEADESDYIGCQQETVSQTTCQYWTSQTPHAHNFLPHLTTWSWGSGTQKKYPTLGDFNFCRNPEKGAGGIWCYTSDQSKRWEYCDPRNVTTIPDMSGVIA